MILCLRGNKADNGAKYGCSGLIIYSDPMEVACEGVDASQVNQGYIQGLVFTMLLY